MTGSTSIATIDNNDMDNFEFEAFVDSKYIALVGISSSDANPDFSARSNRMVAAPFAVYQLGARQRRLAYYDRTKR